MSVTEWVLKRECEVTPPHRSCEVYTLQSDVTGLLNQHLMCCTTSYWCKYLPTHKITPLKDRYCRINLAVLMEIKCIFFYNFFLMEHLEEKKLCFDCLLQV